MDRYTAIPFILSNPGGNDEGTVTQSTLRNLTEASFSSQDPITRGEFVIIVEESLIGPDALFITKKLKILSQM